MQEAIERINQLGSQRVPFICLFDIEQCQPQVWPVKEIIQDELLFCTPLGSNYGPALPPKAEPYQTPAKIDSLTPLCRQRYSRGFKIIQEGLRRGDSFLANLTFPVEINMKASLKEIFEQAAAPYRLWWKDHFVVFSPEAFIGIQGNTIRTWPMKGTILASHPRAEATLLDDKKEAAEHLTVVDLLRNDLGIIGRRVEVERFRYLQRIPSPAGDILQASSCIKAEIETDWHTRIGSLLASISPAGSISGAPKYKTMQLIAQAEAEPRGYYTGVFGHFDGQSFTSAVMIRFIENRPGGLPSAPIAPVLRFRTGGGITIYSQEQKEYDELHAKVRIPVQP